MVTPHCAGERIFSISKFIHKYTSVINKVLYKIIRICYKITHFDSINMKYILSNKLGAEIIKVKS